MTDIVNRHLYKHNRKEKLRKSNANDLAQYRVFGLATVHRFEGILEGSFCKDLEESTDSTGLYKYLTKTNNSVV